MHRRKEGLPHTHTRFDRPPVTPLHVSNPQFFLRHYFSYLEELGDRIGCNSITEKISTQAGFSFPFFADIDFDVRWFSPDAGVRGDGIPQVSPKQIFELIEDITRTYREVLEEAFGRNAQPEYLVAIRTFYKIHLHFPDMFLTVQQAICVVKETLRRIIDEHDPALEPILRKAVDVSVYKTGLRLLGSHKGQMSAKPTYDAPALHAELLPGHPYDYKYLIGKLNAAECTIERYPLTLQHLYLASVLREGVACVPLDIPFMRDGAPRGTKRRYDSLATNSTSSRDNNNNADSEWEESAKEFAMKCLEKVGLDKVTYAPVKIKRYENTGFIEITLRPAPCPFKKGRHNRTEARQASANYIIIGKQHASLRCWKCSDALILDDVPDDLQGIVDTDAHRKHYPLFASLHSPTHERVSNVLFEAMKECYAVSASADGKRMMPYFFCQEYHRWIQHDRALLAIMQDNGRLQKLWKDFVKTLGRDSDTETEPGTESKEQVLFRELEEKLQTTGFVSSLLTVLTRKLEWYWRKRSPKLCGFEQMLDTHVHLTGFTNGVFDSVEKVFRAGKPDDFISKSTHHPYIPYDEYPLEIRNGLQDFLSKIQTVDEERVYLCKVLAKALQGAATWEQLFFILFGEGANGKTKLVTLINGAFGDLAVEVQVTVFTREQAGSEKANPELVKTKGARVITTSEPSEGDVFNMSVIKYMSGSERVTGRSLFQNPVSFQSTAFCFVQTNNRPVILSSIEDRGSWRRLFTIPFDSLFKENPSGPREFDVDTKINSKIDTWAPCFISYLVKIIIDDQEVPVPPRFLEEQIKLRHKNDVMGHFCDTCLDHSPDTFVEEHKVYEEFGKWRRRMNHSRHNIQLEGFTNYLKKHFAPQVVIERENNEKVLRGWNVRITV